jgi:intracellular septation protein A
MVGLVLAALWALWSLALRRAEAFLAACALVGACLSLWLDAQDFIDWRQTLVGLMLMALGVGIIGRGLVLRGQGS